MSVIFYFKSPSHFTHLPAGFLLQFLVLPHFLRVFVLPDKHRDGSTSESFAFMNTLALMREMPAERENDSAVVHKDLNKGMTQSGEN